MRLYDAYRLGFLTRDQYYRFLSSGLSPNSAYTLPDDFVINTPNYVSGMTTSIMTNVLESVTIGSIKQSITIFNTGYTNSLNVQIDCYVANILSDTIDNITVVPRDTYFLETSSAFQKIVIKVQDTISGQHTTFEAGIITS